MGETLVIVPNEKQKKVFLKDGTRQTFRIEGEIGELLPKLASMPVRDLEIIEPALEDVLRSFYREES